MARHGPLKKPTMASMPVLLWLADHPDHLLVSSSSLGHSSYHFAYADGSRYNYREDGRTHLWDGKEKPEWWNNPVPPEVPKNAAVHRWIQSDWLVQIKKEGDYWSWYSHPYRMTKAGREMANKWRDAYEEHARKQAEKQKEVERFIVVRSRSHRGKRQYGFLAKVVRETAARLYVERVPEPDEKEDRWVYFETLHGRRGHQYVERDDVTADGVTEQEYQACRIVEKNHLAWLADLKAQEQAEVDEIRERYRQRRDQNQYAFEDELREAIEQVKRNAA